MNIRYDPSTFFENSGNNAAIFGEKLRDGIVGGACAIWAAYPKFITNGRNPASSYARGFMNQACSGLQPPVPFVPPPFTGGQCCDGQYQVNINYELRRCTGNVVIASGPTQVNVVGKVTGLELRTCLQNPAFTCLDVVYENCTGTVLSETAFSTTRSIAEGDCSGSSPFDPDADDINPVTSTFSIASIVRTDGQPDDCGNPPGGYPDVTPGPGDLDFTFNITNLDGTDVSFTAIWNQAIDNYNFPMSFQVNGSNVTLDVGGVTIFGGVSITSSNNNTFVPPPGSQGGKDLDGTPYVVPYPDIPPPTLPELVVPEGVEDIVEYLLCEEGVLETINDSVKLAPGVSPVVKIILEILSDVVEELCEGESVDLAFPEVYPVLPGTERPAILYIYKELINGKRSRSTYSTTVSNPTQAAIDEIDSIVVPDKSTGKFVASIKLEDGSRIISSGIDELVAVANLTFLLTKVIPTLLPSPLEDFVVITKQERLQERILNCSQIEYYPNGRAAGVSPSVQRLIPPP